MLIAFFCMRIHSKNQTLCPLSCFSCNKSILFVWCSHSKPKKFVYVWIVFRNQWYFLSVDFVVGASLIVVPFISFGFCWTRFKWLFNATCVLSWINLKPFRFGTFYEMVNVTKNSSAYQLTGMVDVQFRNNFNFVNNPNRFIDRGEFDGRHDLNIRSSVQNEVDLLISVTIQWKIYLRCCAFGSRWFIYQI